MKAERSFLSLLGLPALSELLLNVLFEQKGVDQLFDSGLFISSRSFIAEWNSAFRPRCPAALTVKKDIPVPRQVPLSQRDLVYSGRKVHLGSPEGVGCSKSHPIYAVLFSLALFIKDSLETVVFCFFHWRISTILICCIAC